ncbi:hypothetical protein PRIPAC_85609 [Pristionchus pacificus]|uniref:C-type lectin n=1 Tax=Pristionchus pacificus TaxID=54126 RepID=A0A2A6BU30_PRIPA|nr:hypothetical protein PRIPAC_85609 [Pristionchus pacificus]|eukprot:PDM69429.1 C-type lectin [Pristionchus pacificus]
MMRIILLSVLLQVIASCPAGFEHISGECRGNYTKLSTYYDLAESDAVAKCADINGLPIIIHNNEQQNYWTSRVAGNGAWTLLGLQCNSSSQWQWADGSSLDYKAPGHDSMLNGACSVGTFVVLRKDGFWSYYAASHSAWTTDLFCTVPVLHPTQSPDNCFAFADDVDFGLCYQVGAAAANWQDAQLICRKLGANLASIHNYQENTFVRRLGVSNGAMNGLFLGAALSGKGGSYGWIDGTPWDYQNFAPAFSWFPRDDFGDCIAMDTTSSTGGWMNIECTKKLPVACVREKGTYEEPVCNEKTYTEEGKLITSPGFPYTASLPCDFFFEVGHDQNVEVEMAFRGV